MLMRGAFHCAKSGNGLVNLHTLALALWKHTHRPQCQDTHTNGLSGVLKLREQAQRIVTSYCRSAELLETQLWPNTIL